MIDLMEALRRSVEEAKGKRRREGDAAAAQAEGCCAGAPRRSGRPRGSSAGYWCGVRHGAERLELCRRRASCRSCPGRSARLPRGRPGSLPAGRSRAPSTALPASGGSPSGLAPPSGNEKARRHRCSQRRGARRAGSRSLVVSAGINGPAPRELHAHRGYVARMTAATRILGLEERSPTRRRGRAPLLRRRRGRSARPRPRARRRRRELGRARRALRRAGIRVLVPDLPGHGGSARLPGQAPG